ncbi:EamA family transporter, partial [Streptomyces sp. NPDC057271]|uniref:EamA family transporter n=1 Tax=Streptomyces sp. NPDC057271 TaxID=3346078 RepID=UPI003633CB1B
REGSRQAREARQARCRKVSRNLPASAGRALQHLQPVCVALLSYALLGEELGLLEAACMALILGGVVLAGARPRA